MPQQTDHDNDSKIQWHPAFCEAMKLEFREDRERLDFQSEKILNTAPLRIDLLILVLRGDGSLHNPIGAIFKKYNIIEYKPPGDAMSVDDFYKTLAYACLYKEKSGRVNACPANEITLTMLREAYPREMIHALRRLS